MFCALNGATRTPLRASNRHNPATTIDLPASEVVPATSSAPLTFPRADRIASGRSRELRARGSSQQGQDSAPSSVTTRVCSNCAVHLRSLVATVQPSSQIS